MPSYGYECSTCGRQEIIARPIKDRHQSAPCKCGSALEFHIGLSAPRPLGRCMDPISGWYHDIDTKPIYINDRHHLKQECDKRGLVAEVLKKDVGSPGQRNLQNVVPRVSHRSRRDPRRTQGVVTREAGCDIRTTVY